MSKRQLYVSEKSLDNVKKYAGLVPKEVVIEAAIEYVVDKVPFMTLMQAQEQMNQFTLTERTPSQRESFTEEII